ncbi:MAG TPA: hypothetical protein VMW41_03030 [Candidatus Bathyarchaeia archaeon]|nr:hypothetical protein [Candidatus Bathyarchaeia archaeon]
MSQTNLKKNLIILIIIIAVAGLVSVGIFLSKKIFEKPGLVEPILPEELPQKAVTMSVWEDPAGFTFSYPAEVKIDPHEEDEENYAHLDLTSPDYEGNIVIWVKDTKYRTIDSWLKDEGTDGQAVDTELGGEPAKKVVYSNPEKIITAAIDVDALVLIEMTPDLRGYWQDVYSKVLDTFVFIPIGQQNEGTKSSQPASEESGTGTSGNIIMEPEEVIE